MRYRSPTFLLTATLLMLHPLSGCDQAQGRGAIADPPTLDAWTAAHNRGDADALVGTYAADAILLPPDGSVASGHDAVRATFASTLGIQGVRLERIAGWQDSDLASEVGRWEHFAHETRQTTSAGTYTVVWRKDPTGAWLIVMNGWAVRRTAAAGEGGSR